MVWMAGWREEGENRGTDRCVSVQRCEAHSPHSHDYKTPLKVPYVTIRDALGPRMFSQGLSQAASCKGEVFKARRQASKETSPDQTAWVPDGQRRGRTALFCPKHKMPQFPACTRISETRRSKLGWVLGFFLCLACQTLNVCHPHKLPHNILH